MPANNPTLRRRLVKKRGAKCEECGLPFEESVLTVHHIIPRLIRPDLKSVDENAVLLCEACHKFLHKMRAMPREKIMVFQEGMNWVLSEMKKKSKPREVVGLKNWWKCPDHLLEKDEQKRKIEIQEKARIKQKILMREGFSCQKCGKRSKDSSFFRVDDSGIGKVLCPVCNQREIHKKENLECPTSTLQQKKEPRQKV